MNESTFEKLAKDAFGVNLEDLQELVPLNVNEANIGVLGYDKKIKKNIYTKVNYLIYKGMYSTLEIATENTKSSVSEEHLFSTDKGYESAKQLKIGDLLHTENGLEEIISIEKGSSQKIYDVETETGNLYVNGILSHNSSYSHLPAVTGGEAPKFYASTVNRITKTDVIKQGNETVGIEIRVRNYKNKCGIPFRDANMKLYYKDSFRPHDEYVQFLIDLGVVEQKGAYFKSEKYGFSLQGRAKLQEWLDANPEEYEKLKVQVNEMLIGYTILDKDNVAVSETENDPLSAPGIDTSKGFSDDDIIVDEPEEQAPLAKRKTAEQKAEELASMALATTEVVEEEKTSNESSDDVIIDE